MERCLGNLIITVGLFDLRSVQYIKYVVMCISSELVNP